MNSISKGNVVFILGATSTGKSKLAINLATHYRGEVINSNKMQLYHGLNVITNKVTATECADSPHHLIRVIPPSMNFSAMNFCQATSVAVDSIFACDRFPIIARGSNSYIRHLVEGNHSKFRGKHDCIFQLIHVDLPVLHAFLVERVDRMVEMGLVEAARGVFNPECSDYSQGIRRAIGLQEMDWYLRTEQVALGEKERAGILAATIHKIKVNTCKLACYQHEKIRRMVAIEGWDVWQRDATDVFK